MSQDVLFVLSQNHIEMEAIKSSNLVRIFKNIVFVEPELYKNTELTIPQPIELGGMLVNVDRINTFVKNISNDEKFKQTNVKSENMYILSMTNFLQSIKQDVSGKEIIKAQDAVNVHLFHNGTFTYTIGGLADVPEIYVEELKSISKPIFQVQEDTNKQIVLGCDKSLGSLIAEIKNVPEDNWCKEFNDFDRTQQIIYTLNNIDYKPLIINYLKENDSLDITKCFSNITYKNMLNVTITKKILDFTEKNKIVIDCISAAEENGIMLGVFISDILGLPFVPIKYHSECLSETYEYDSYKVQQNSMETNKVVLIVDDIITDGIKQKSIHSVLNFFFPRVSLFFTLGLFENQMESIKEHMGELFNNIITL
jgi:hypothetical protein